MKITIKESTSKLEGKKLIRNLYNKEETFTLDNESRDKFIELINYLAAKVDILGSLNKLIDKVDLLQKIDADKVVKIIKKLMEDKR